METANPFRHGYPFRGIGNGLKGGYRFPPNGQVGTRSHPFRTCSRNRLGGTRSGCCPGLWPGTGPGASGDSYLSFNARTDCRIPLGDGVTAGVSAPLLPTPATATKAGTDDR